MIYRVEDNLSVYPIVAVEIQSRPSHTKEIDPARAAELAAEAMFGTPIDRVDDDVVAQFMASISVYEITNRGNRVLVDHREKTNDEG